MKYKAHRIVFINQAVGYLTIDIINEFAKVFTNVALITGSIRVQNIELDDKVHVSRIIRYNRGTKLKKALSWLIGSIQIYFLLLFRYRGFDRFYFTIPPLAYLNATLSHMPFALAIYDHYPEALMANGIREDGMFYKWWAVRNREIYPKAQIVYALSHNLESIVRSYAPDSNVVVIPNWSAFSGWIPISRNKNRYIIDDKLEDKFVVQYSGNIGVTHNVETLVEVAAALRAQKDIHFQIIGRGDRAGFIGELIRRKQLQNCQILPFRNDEYLYESLCSAQLAIVILDNKTTDISVPSKIYNIMAAGVPMMAIAPPMSAVAGIVKEYQIGAVFDKVDISGMSEFLLEMRNNPDLRNMMAENSLKASCNFTKANAGKYLEFYLKSRNNC